MSRSNQQLARLIQELIRMVRSGKLSVRWLIGLAVLVVGYLLLQPVLERKLGVDLPGLGDLQTASSPSQSPPNRSEKASPPDTLQKILSGNHREVYVSSAGLRYTRGSQHGHRIKHLLAHSKDIPDRPGKHGVFDTTDPSELIALVDEAYLQALTGKHTQVKQEGSRTVYEVGLGRRVGYIGGETGNRRGRPAARHVRMVIDGRNIITVFPFRP